ncbi:MAG: TRAP transporter substrate-binding protein [Acetobacteraceae bacterium]
MATAAILFGSGGARAQRHLSFAYDQPKSTGFGVAGDIFGDTLKRLSKGQLLIDQFPGAQLGQEPQALQKIRTGDIDFMVSSTANAATLSPQSGVMSLHFLFKSEDHLIKALGDPAVVAAMRDMFGETVTGVRVLGLATLGFRYMYGKKEIHRVEDMRGLKVRVQATATEDAIFPAYGAQTVHMPFGSVYTSLQTGVVDAAENGVNVYAANKHYEAAPIMSMTMHEANNSLLTVSDKVWNSLTEEQRGWVQEAADEVSRTQPAKAFALDRESQARLTKMGVKFVTDVDLTRFIAIATPLQDSIAKDLGPYATKILTLIRATPQ